jgi:hypothetical protein
MSIDRCHVRDLPRITDVRGNLSYIEGPSLVPFDIQRIYYLYDVPGGADRGAHAHKALHQLVVALSGAFDIVLDDGKDRKSVRLDRAYKSLYICPMIWRTLNNFSSGAVCLVLASERYDESDYIRDYGDFLKAVNRQEIVE